MELITKSLMIPGNIPIEPGLKINLVIKYLLEISAPQSLIKVFMNVAYRRLYLWFSGFL